MFRIIKRLGENFAVFKVARRGRKVWEVYEYTLPKPKQMPLLVNTRKGSKGK